MPKTHHRVRYFETTQYRWSQTYLEWYCSVSIAFPLAWIFLCLFCLWTPTAANKHTVSLVISCQIASLVLLTHSDWPPCLLLCCLGTGPFVPSMTCENKKRGSSESVMTLIPHGSWSFWSEWVRKENLTTLEHQVFQPIIICHFY